MLLAQGDMTGLIGLAGQLAGVILVVWFFLVHNSKQAELNREALKDTIKRIELIEEKSEAANLQIAVQFTGAVNEFREENRTTINNLLGINRSTVEVMGGVSARVGELGAQVGQLKDAVDHLADRVDKIDEMPPKKPTR